MMKKSFFADLPEKIPEEMIEIICRSQTIRIERIVSQGHISPADFWYDQNENEWIIILRGRAKIEFANKIIELEMGDYLEIPAHIKHRVCWTDPCQKTIWLAVFYPTSK